jgi:hypothetical protein
MSVDVLAWSDQHDVDMLKVFSRRVMDDRLCDWPCKLIAVAPTRSRARD